jgi:hypothetical protein
MGKGAEKRSLFARVKMEARRTNGDFNRSPLDAADGPRRSQDVRPLSARPLPSGWCSCSTRPASSASWSWKGTIANLGLGGSSHFPDPLALAATPEAALTAASFGPSERMCIRLLNPVFHKS